MHFLLQIMDPPMLYVGSFGSFSILGNISITLVFSFS